MTLPLKIKTKTHLSIMATSESACRSSTTVLDIRVNHCLTILYDHFQQGIPNVINVVQNSAGFSKLVNCHLSADDEEKNTNHRGFQNPLVVLKQANSFKYSQISLLMHSPSPVHIYIPRGSQCQNSYFKLSFYTNAKIGIQSSKIYFLLSLMSLYYTVINFNSVKENDCN